jgi:hypothetical protein
MKARTLAIFTAAGFPDDSEWTANGSPLVPEGRSIAEVLVKAVRAQGLQASDPAQHLFYGWCFDVTVSGGVAWCLLQQPGPWLLLVRNRRSLVHRLFRNSGESALANTLAALHRALKTDGRFSALQWLTEEAFESGSREGAEAPL